MNEFWRSLVRIEKREGKRAEVVIPGWNPHVRLVVKGLPEIVPLPMSMDPHDGAERTFAEVTMPEHGYPVIRIDGKHYQTKYLRHNSPNEL